MMFRTILAAMLVACPALSQTAPSPSYSSVTITTAPTQANQATTKGYVDTAISTATSGVALTALPSAGALSSTDLLLLHQAGGDVKVTLAGLQAFLGVVATGATGATIAGAPATGTAAVAITGITDTLTPSNATAYAVLALAGVDEGSRQAFTGTTFPSIAPASTGSYAAKIYAAATGGVALATSSTITVTAAPIAATAATLANIPTTGTAGTPLTMGTASDTLTPGGATAYAVLFTGSADEGSRVSFTGTTPPTLTPATAASYTYRVYAAPTGGTALATSPAITVAAGGAVASTKYTLDATGVFQGPGTAGSFGGSAFSAQHGQLHVSNAGATPTSITAVWTRSNTVVPTPGTGPNQYGSNGNEFAASTNSGGTQWNNDNLTLWGKGAPTTGSYYLWLQCVDAVGTFWEVWPTALVMSP